ncbi:MAG: hypothetical protein H6819_12200 [Phycisphaerales bacterium]|nr:hypothetical protein [Phycisphaerales bacterium]MCB9858710.1 hypothetical protein [Phycisphaerales bacterium]MCB9864434.1 hypothetical protein [Phycisphaerales bacterium]
MKLTLTCALFLLLAVAATVAVGYAPSHNRWGDEGQQSLLAVAAICGGAALVALIPMAVVAPRYPGHIGEAALAGTVIRLLVTMGAFVVYQVLYQPHMTSFLFWAPVFYLVLLAIETTFGVLAVKRYYRPTPKSTDGATS